MAHNVKRAARMRQLSVGELKRIVDRGSLASAAASYALHAYHGIIHAYQRKD
jgi:hypothetical protein